MMKKMMVSLLLGVLPLTLTAQDDMYFVPSKKSAVQVKADNDGPTSTYYSGSNRSVDDYNRRGGSYYQVIASDTTGNDIINFSAERGVYPDSAQTEDFALTRQMSRWDGYTPAETYWQGYSDGREDALGWHSPWYYSSFYPWYDSYWYWNDPWYYRHYGWYSPWYDPWYYGSYHWHHPYWYGGFHYWGGFHGGGLHHGGGLYARNGHTGTIDLRGGSRGRFSSGTTTRRSTSTARANANTPVRSTSGNFSRSSNNSSINNSNFNRGSSTSSGSSSFSRSSSGGGFSSGGGSRSGGVSRGGRR